MTALVARIIVDRLREGVTTRWTVRGGSMWPAIRDGATVSVTPVAAGALRYGDLVAFTRGDAVVVHRVVAVEPGGLRCRGDALPREDGLVAWADVLGRASVIEQRALTWRWPRVREVRALFRAALGGLRSGRA